MAKKAAVIMPQTREILAQMGEQIRLARLRRKLSLELVAERAGSAEPRLYPLRKAPLRYHRLLCRCVARIKQYGQQPAAYCKR